VSAGGRPAGAARAVVVHPDAGVLASAVAARLLTLLLDVQSVRRPAHVVLTGGTVGIALLAEVAASPVRDAVDWTGVHVWWGDERFLPAGDPDRNETQARAALLDALPLDPARVHAMPASDGPDGDDAEAAAARYAQELRGPFDVLMLGVGEDGHVASIFPGHPVNDVTATTAAVHDSPKPPPVRVTLTMPTIRTAEEVWLIASGPDKAAPVGNALDGIGDLPASRARGTAKTLWLLDRAAAAETA